MKRLFYIVCIFINCEVLVAQQINRIAGDSIAGFGGDGGLAINSRMDFPVSVSIDKPGNIYLVDGNNRVRKINKNTSVITTIAGGGINPPINGDTATQVKLNSPAFFAFDSSGNMYLTENACLIRKIDKQTNIITTLAGTSSGYSGDNGPSTAAQLQGPQGLCLDESRNFLYVADQGNHRVRKIDLSTGIISTVAGTGTPGFSGDGGLAINADINSPGSVAVDLMGNIYLSDVNNRIRRVDINTGIITTFAGTSQGYSGDGGPAQTASMWLPYSLVFDKAFANLYFSDSGNSRIRKIDMNSNIITSIAGGGTTWIGNGGPASQAMLANPYGLCISKTNDLIIADTYNNEIREIPGDQTGYYYHFPDSNAVWHYHWNLICNSVPSDFYYTITMPGDTVIKNKTYHKLVIPSVAPVPPIGCNATNPGYAGAVRQDTSIRKVFIIPKSDSTEQVLYDFNLHVGDSVRGYLKNMYAGSLDYVHSMDSVLVGGFYRKRWNINFTYGISLIEGIGSTFGLIVPSPGEIADVPLRYLDCFEQNGQVFFPSGASGCQQLTFLKENKEPDIRVFPNPANKTLTIEGEGVKNIRLFDLMGEEKENSMDIGNLPNGIYFIYIKTPDGIFTKKIIVQH